MDFKDRLLELSKKISQQGANLQTEEATKNAFVMPFLHSVLGYDVFNPQEVMPEFTADTGTKKGEKVDYAIRKDDEIQILVECKKFGEKLSLNHASQLYRYFSVTDARIAVLTNGSVYQFFTDLDSPNRMDEKPFLEIDLERLDDHLIPEVKKLAKDTFDIEHVISTAGDLKYTNQIKKLIAQQVIDPEDDFVKFFASRVYSGPITQKVREQFREITKLALSKFLNDRVNDRLKSALDNSANLPESDHAGEDENIQQPSDTDHPKIHTTEEEVEGYHIVRALIRDIVSPSRIASRDTQSYFGILLDDNNRKPICRLYFNAGRKYIGLFDDKKTETRHPIESVDDIYLYADQLKKTPTYYETFPN